MLHSGYTHVSLVSTGTCGWGTDQGSSDAARVFPRPKSGNQMGWMDDGRWWSISLTLVYCRVRGGGLGFRGGGTGGGGHCPTFLPRV